MKKHFLAMAIALACLPCAGCGIIGDQTGDVTGTLVNGCDHEVSVYFSESNTYLIESGYSEDLRYDSSVNPLAAGDSDSITPLEGQTVIFEAIIFSDTESVQVVWGQDLGEPNTYTIIGDACLPPVSAYG